MNIHDHTNIKHTYAVCDSVTQHKKTVLMCTWNLKNYFGLWTFYLNVIYRTCIAYSESEINGIVWRGVFCAHISTVFSCRVTYAHEYKLTLEHIHTWNVGG